MKKNLSNNQLINKIIQGDALEVMKIIEHNSIDVVLTDPPYFLDKLDLKNFHNAF